MVIVNAANPAREPDREAGEELFHEEAGTWADGREFGPSTATASVPGAAFLVEGAGHVSSDELKRYWISRQYATADEPPPKVRDDA